MVLRPQGRLEDVQYGEDKMGLLKRFLSFHVSDILGIISGIVLISNEDTFGSFFDVLRSYWLYIFICLGVFIFDMWTWFVEYRGETAYLNDVFESIFRDCICTTLAMISTVGVYACFTFY